MPRLGAAGRLVFVERGPADLSGLIGILQADGSGAVSDRLDETVVRRDERLRFLAVRPEVHRASGAFDGLGPVETITAQHCHGVTGRDSLLAQEGGRLGLALLKNGR